MRFAATSALGVALCVCSLGVAGCADDRSDEVPGLATVVEVIDGDTIDVEIGGRTERVRLIGIDTPETMRPNTPVECYGPEAGEFTASLLPIGAEVRVERDIVGRDDYGRLLGYVHLTTRSDAHGGSGGEIFVNLEIVERGFARPLAFEPNTTFARDFAAAAGRAERAELGMWAHCS